MAAVNPSIPRPEYPRPQMVRPAWINLNGEWEFEIDHGSSGKQRRLFEAASLAGKITVPFCPESKLSGVENKDFMRAVWYRRTIDIPSDWSGGRVLLHFGAVDYATEVWVNGKSAGTHRGGYSSFSFDITDLLESGANVLTVCAEDDLRSGLQPRGKQSGLYHSHGCDYTRTTGIWQTVWLESVPRQYIRSFKLTPDMENGALHIDGEFIDADGFTLTAEGLFDGKIVGTESAVVSGRQARLTVKLSERHLWEVGSPKLYDLNLSLRNGGSTVDRVESYFGLRSVKWDNNAILINGKPVFQRLVLDQGFYPDGIYTAPSDEDLKRDIKLSMELGFNGARLHEKVFEARFLYWADRLGYLVWGEHANWGLDITTAQGLQQFLPEWTEIVSRDYNSPALVGWCPFNETWDNSKGARQDNEVLRIVYHVTKSLDATRPVIDTSGNFHVVTDIFDVHDYEQNPEKFAQHYEAMRTGGERFVTFKDRQRYEGQPYFVSEYGGIWWNPGQADEKSWGYGDRPKTEEEFLARYEGLTLTLLENPYICAFCYTQLYDVEQEVNGLLTYCREHKFNPDQIRKINATVAAIEKQFANAAK
ncbi:glycoside hydrolase family 2 protein [Paenibacillus arenilitoris]|uniref:Beta-galactosidase n=1 Tax=Paenibacillus arenilitoris TaxID=2772299 RepID=A0A927CN70_9BACL|nr:sugar-binding domain-containing protein [Paenibacillus arenilitoris]MBD2869947.1 beta-galactosidase [Paenibacillus arenilitoris]